MTAEVDLQVLIFMIFFALATTVVFVTKKRKKKRYATRCRSCGRTLDFDRDSGDLCLDCHRISRT
jgi:hypothetical protein